MIAFLIALILSFFSVAFSKSKIIATLFMVFIWILYGWNFSNGDYGAYEKIYNASILSLVDENYEIGFRLLCITASLSGLSFQGFLIILSGIIVILFSRFFLKYSSHPAFVVLVFFWFFFPLDYVLLRNFLAFSLVLQGLICVFDDVKFKYIKFAAFVLLGSSIHYSSIFYFILIPFFTLKKPASLTYVIMLVILGVFLYKVVGQGIVAVYLSSGDRGDAYQTNLITFIALFICQLLGTGFVIYLYKMLQRDESFEHDSKFYLIFLNVNIAVFFITVMYFDFSIFVRLYRNVALINCVFISNLVFGLFPMNVLKKAKMAVFFICYLIFFFIYFIAPFLNDTLISLFMYNKLLGWHEL